MPLNKDDPRSLGGHRIVDRLGAGGMGVVYRATSRSGREVAVKVVHAQYAGDPVFRTRFRQEIEAVRRVSGAFTAPVVDADPEAARPWMATQYVPAPSLADRIRADGPLRGEELRRLALGLVEALREIHRVGVVHRDLKPANVLMAEDGPRVIDFGISRAVENQTLTETGRMIGTPPFMSPEQLTDARSVGPSSDVFALGALLTYAATGRGPFDADSPYLTAYRVMNGEPALDAVPQPLREVLARCLLKAAADRPGLAELAGEFARVLPGTGPDDSTTVTLRRPASEEVRTPTSADPASVDPASAGRRPRLGTVPAVVGTVCLLVVALTAYLVRGPLKGEGTTEGGGAAGPAQSRWGTLPEGWRPWRTTVHEPAAAGVVRAPDVAGGVGWGGSLSCAMSGASLYCGGDGTLPVRVDARTGKTLWRADSVPSGRGGDRYGSTVLGERDGVLLVSQTVRNAASDDERTDVVGLDADSGRWLWSHTVGTGNSEPTLVGDLLLVPAGGARVTALSPGDGAERWTAAFPAGHPCVFHEGGSRPYAVCTDYDEDGGPGSESVLLAVDPADGATRKVTSFAFDGVHLGTLGGRPILVEYGERGGVTSEEPSYTRVVTIDPETGSRRSVELAGEPRGRVALAHGVLCVASSGGRVTALSPETGERLWQTATTLEQPGSPMADGRGDTVYTASASGRVAALDVGDGTLLWESAPRAGRIDGGFGRSEMFLDEGALVVSTPDGTLFTLDPAHPQRRPASE
ncbi:PQQ-binding-like beta-propeller repeat protein [Streptomyces sp. NPDC048737]|uniref:outer membrane protein assembly factor BamB family protein n=1 Tax=unclassified Streptomyces TaxID=2593676 RepID=UPI0034337B21